MNPVASSATSAAPAADQPRRLTSLSHGGGCGCKIAPGMLRDLLSQAGARSLPPELLVGIETSDDAAVYRINDTQAIVATTDFFMPIVDDPRDFGAIAATNAISDIYAMGAKPLLALALVAMPVNVLEPAVIRAILAGGEDACARAGIPVAGGHTIDSVEPIYGLVVIGIGDPRNIKRNCGACDGDALVLGKPLGIGIYGAALKKNRLDAAGYEAMVAIATRLNTPGIALGDRADVHALTDVTGFGLAGHLLEICRASNVAASVEWARVPRAPGVERLVDDGHVTGASARNWAAYGGDVTIAATLPASTQALLCDPQTSGGLLVACASESAGAIVDIFRRDGFADAAIIGRFDAGAPRLTVS